MKHDDRNCADACRWSCPNSEADIRPESNLFSALWGSSTSSWRPASPFWSCHLCFCFRSKGLRCICLKMIDISLSAVFAEAFASQEMHSWLSSFFKPADPIRLSDWNCLVGKTSGSRLPHQLHLPRLSLPRPLPSLQALHRHSWRSEQSSPLIWTVQIAVMTIFYCSWTNCYCCWPLFLRYFGCSSDSLEHFCEINDYVRNFTEHYCSRRSASISFESSLLSTRHQPPSWPASAMGEILLHSLLKFLFGSFLYVWMLFFA